MTVLWDPAQYGKFAGQRLRPVADLLAAIALDAPKAIIDLGCGDGRVSRLLAERWPDAALTGVDSSPEMLDAARRSVSDVEWVEADLASWSAETPADLVFANAYPALARRSPGAVSPIDGHGRRRRCPGDTDAA